MSRVFRGIQFDPGVTPDDVVRHALAAYYRAAKDATPPIDDPEPQLWSDADTFLGCLCDLFRLRLRGQAGLLEDQEQARLALWSASTPDCERHISEVDPGLWQEVQQRAGRSPVDMGQGCPALLSARSATASFPEAENSASFPLPSAPLSEGRFSEQSGGVSS